LFDGEREKKADLRLPLGGQLREMSNSETTYSSSSTLAPALGAHDAIGDASDVWSPSNAQGIGSASFGRQKTSTAAGHIAL
jgi:hypothetical protein